jgi:hypothetical protein
MQKSGESNHKTQNIEFQNLTLTKIILYGKWKGACQQFSIRGGHCGSSKLGKTNDIEKKPCW